MLNEQLLQNVVAFTRMALTVCQTFKDLHDILDFSTRLQTTQAHLFLHIRLYEIIVKKNIPCHCSLILLKAQRKVEQGEPRDYGSVTSDFSLLLLIASIVWKASCGKRATHGYYTQTYYPWQKKWDEKTEIIAKELLPQGGITHSLQRGWFPSDWRRLHNSSCALVVRRSPVTSPPPVWVCKCIVYYVFMKCMVCDYMCVFCMTCSHLFGSCMLFFSGCLQWFKLILRPHIDIPISF